MNNNLTVYNRVEKPYLTVYNKVENPLEEYIEKIKGSFVTTIFSYLYVDIDDIFHNDIFDLLNTRL